MTSYPSSSGFSPTAFDGTPIKMEVRMMKK
jgi:hypothetical protein